MDDLASRQAIDLIDELVIATDDLERIIFANKAYQELTGWSHDDLKDKNYKLAYHHEDGQESGTIYKKDGKKLVLPAKSFPLYHPVDQEILLGKITIFYLKDQNDDSGKIHSLFDNSQAVHYGHNIKSLLTNIIALADISLKQDSVKQDSAGLQKESFQKIKKYAFDISRKIDEQIFLSLECENVVTPLKRSISLENLKQLLDNEFSLRERVILDFPQSSPAKIYTDAEWLKKLLTMLIQDALACSSDDGRSVVLQISQKQEAFHFFLSFNDSITTAEAVKSQDNEFNKFEDIFFRKRLHMSLINLLGGVVLETSDSGSDDQQAITAFSLPAYQSGIDR